MKGRIGTSATTTTVVGPALQRIASGWIDEEIVTVRKMAAAGATADDIAAAIGKSKTAVRNIVKRNNLTWNHKSEERHLLKSAQAIGSHMVKGAYEWRAEALDMRRAGKTLREISAALGVNITMLSRLCREHGLGRVKLAHDGRCPASKSEEASAA